jgi:hypothetical protein
VNRTLEQIKFDFEALSFSDFDHADMQATGAERLDNLCKEIEVFVNVEVAISLLFQTMERLDGCDLGSPGPLVHTIEAMPNYEHFLKESLSRKPTQLSVWMVNRVINSAPRDKHIWLDLLRGTLPHPAASVETKDEAREFLGYQKGD